MTHLLNCYEIWCETHHRYEWHNIPRAYVRYGGTIQTTRKPLWEKGGL